MVIDFRKLRKLVFNFAVETDVIKEVEDSILHLIEINIKNIILEFSLKILDFILLKNKYAEFIGATLKASGIYYISYFNLY